eukprot:855523-Amphidinium_carterae.1
MLVWCRNVPAKVLLNCVRGPTHSGGQSAGLPWSHSCSLGVWIRAMCRMLWRKCGCSLCVYSRAWHPRRDLSELPGATAAKPSVPHKLSMGWVGPLMIGTR